MQPTPLGRSYGVLMTLLAFILAGVAFVEHRANLRCHDAASRIAQQQMNSSSSTIAAASVNASAASSSPRATSVRAAKKVTRGPRDKRRAGGTISFDSKGWQRHARRNCYPGFGGVDFPRHLLAGHVQGEALPNASACLERCHCRPGCAGITTKKLQPSRAQPNVSPHSLRCWLLVQIHLDACDRSKRGKRFDTWTLARGHFDRYGRRCPSLYVYELEAAYRDPDAARLRGLEGLAASTTRTIWRLGKTDLGAESTPAPGGAAVEAAAVDQYHLGHVVYERALTHSCRTRDASTADLFFIPAFSARFFDSAHSVNARTSLIEALHRVRVLSSDGTREVSALERHLGRDHFLVQPRAGSVWERNPYKELAYDDKHFGKAVRSWQ